MQKQFTVFKYWDKIEEIGIKLLIAMPCSYKDQRCCIGRKYINNIKTLITIPTES